MFTKILNKIFPRRKGNKRGISPVIATILLIALTVAAAAIVYFVVVPLLQGKGEMVQMSGVTLSDADVDGKYDTVTVELFNVGTDLVTLDIDVDVITYLPTSNTTQWQIQGSLEFLTQETREITISTSTNESEIAPLTQYEMVIYYGSRSLSFGRLLSSFGTGGQSGPEPGANYTSSPLVLRTSADDPSVCSSTFPVSSGYSPVLWFLVGSFESGVRNLDSNTNDYINSNGFGTAQDYRPYVGIPDFYTQSISFHTGYQVLPLQDAGDYPGCVTIRGTSYDSADTLAWPNRGIAYLFTYIYNPTVSAMDVDLSVQVDDMYTLWVNGNLEGSGDRSGDTSWRTPVTINLNPGYNIVTIRATCVRGDWNAQILMWDTGATDNLTELLNVWPFVVPTSTYW